MKNRTAILVYFVLLLFMECYAQKYSEPFYDSEYLYINNIKLCIDNFNGLDHWEKAINGAGLWDRIFQGYFINDYYIGEAIVYAHGLWLLGKNNYKQVYNYHWWSRTNYSPGPIIDGNPVIQDSSAKDNKFRVFRISNNNNVNTDIRDWPSEYGAPADEKNNPLLFADQTIWTVANSCDTSNSKQYFNSEPILPVKLEIQQTAYAYEGDINSNMLSDVIFLEWTIMNKGDERIDSTYIGLWCDLDMISPSHNPPAVDTLRQLGYCWTDYPGSMENYLGKKYPAVGYVMLYGPKINSPGDTAIFRGKKQPNFKNLPLSSFWGLTDTGAPLTNLPRSINQGWNIAKGLDLSGNTIIDSVSGTPTKFPYSGDPVTNTGWNWNYSTEGEAGFYMFTGPFTFEPADTQWVMYAITAGLDTNKLASITKLRRNVDIIRSLNYDELVKITPINYENSSVPPEYFYLSQNYPNPFNPITKIRYELPIQSHVNLSVYDILGRKVSELVNKEQNAGYYEVEIDGSNWASGVYFIRIESYTFSKSIKAILLK